MSDDIRDLYLGYALLDDPDGNASEQHRLYLKKNIFYDKGGYYDLNNKLRKRGYYLSVRPVSISYPSHTVGERVYVSRIEGSTSFSGACILLEEADRFSAVKANEIVSENVDNSWVDMWMMQKGLRYAGGRAVYESMAAKNNGRKKERKGLLAMIRGKK